MADARGPVGGKLAGAAEHRRAGRPRLRPASNADVPPREEILDAAAGLFVSQGLAATTTRQIAERVGIRQASLYYYFTGKDEILLELLTQSVRPSLQVAAMLESRCRDDPAAGLYALALIDVQTLTRAPHNIATLYLVPEVQGEEFASFRAERSQLQAVYGRLGRAAAPSAGLDETLIATLVMQVVESVIHLRRSGDLRDSHAHDIAASCLRLLGLGAPQVTRARAAAGRVLAVDEYLRLSARIAPRMTAPVSGLSSMRSSVGARSDFHCAILATWLTTLHGTGPSTTR